MRADPLTPGRSRAARRVPGLVLAVLVALAPGCGRQQPRENRLSFEDLSDTLGLSKGAPLVRAFEPYRLAGGAMRVRGNVDLPDGTRLQISVLRVANGETVERLQVTVQDRAFETAPFMGPRGPLPPDRYRFDVLAHFNPAWQPDAVLRATHDGHSLRGPGVTRGTGGEAAFYLREERRL